LKNEWVAELFSGHKPVGSAPDAFRANGPEPVELELIVEDWLKEHGKEGQAFGRIRWMGDRRVHYIVRLMKDKVISIENTPYAKWPIEIPPWNPDAEDALPDEGEPDFEWPIEMEGEPEPDEPDKDEGEGESEMTLRIFGRFFDGRRWRKQSVGDPEKPIQRQKAQFGLIDEREAEIEGENSRRARQVQASVEFHRWSDGDDSLLRVRLPRDVDFRKVGNLWVATISTEDTI
jgi:hypothetical protein